MIKRGDIYFIRDTRQSIGSEQKADRPAVICYKEATEGGIVVVMLIPARTDTIMFHDYILGKAEIRFIKGRVNFEIDGQKSKDPAPFPSMIVVFNGKQPTSAVKSITA